MCSLLFFVLIFFNGKNTENTGKKQNSRESGKVASLMTAHLQHRYGPVLAVAGRGDELKVRVHVSGELLTDESRLPHHTLTTWADVHDAVTHLHNAMLPSQFTSAPFLHF